MGKSKNELSGNPQWIKNIAYIHKQVFWKDWNRIMGVVGTYIHELYFNLNLRVAVKANVFE